MQLYSKYDRLCVRAIDCMIVLSCREGWQPVMPTCPALLLISNKSTHVSEYWDSLIGTSTPTYIIRAPLIDTGLEYCRCLPLGDVR